MRVEADTASGFPKFTMVGLPDSALKESECRIRAALRHCGYGFKWDRRITVNLAPAHLRKAGSSYDLATAVGLLAADGLMPGSDLEGVLLVGELALDGRLRPVPGVLPMLLMARRERIRAAIVPEANAGEASIVEGVDVYPAASLPDAVALAPAEGRPSPPPVSRRTARPQAQADLSDVRGQPLARRALEIAAAGGHNLLFTGPPGSGKTLLAQRLPGLLPPLTLDESLETTAIHSAAGAIVESRMDQRPFRSPHHTASQAALVGGGSLPRPGEASLAHNGVLFLDELTEFSRRTLDALRQPLEERAVTVARVRSVIRLPARFQLVAAMNPCPCGWRGDPVRPCGCTPNAIRAYQARVSGPLLDRIDLHAEVPALRYADIDGPPGEPSATVAERVLRARGRQAARHPVTGALTNADLTGAQARAAARPDAEGRRLLERAVDRWRLSGRAHDRILRVSRTLADLEGLDAVRTWHVAEALHFRGWSDDTE